MFAFVILAHWLQNRCHIGYRIGVANNERRTGSKTHSGIHIDLCQYFQKWVK